MDTKITAEFRIIKTNKIVELIRSSVIEKTVKKRFLGLSHRIEYQDNFESYINENTSLIGTISGKGFLYFNDLICFLKEFKSISIKQIDYDITSIIDREESAMFISLSEVTQLFDTLNKIQIEPEDLTKFNERFEFGTLMKEIIPYQKEQIKQFILILSQIKSDTLFIRSEHSS